MRAFNKPCVHHLNSWSKHTQHNVKNAVRRKWIHAVSVWTVRNKNVSITAPKVLHGWFSYCPAYIRIIGQGLWCESSAYLSSRLLSRWRLIDPGTYSPVVWTNPALPRLMNRSLIILIMCFRPHVKPAPSFRHRPTDEPERIGSTRCWTTSNSHPASSYSYTCGNWGNVIARKLVSSLEALPSIPQSCLSSVVASQGF